MRSNPRHCAGSSTRFETATHHPAVYVAGVVLGIQTAGLTSAAATYLLAERRPRPPFAHAFPGEPAPRSADEAMLGTRPRLLVSWALGSGVAVVAIAVGFRGRGDERRDALVGPVLFLVVDDGSEIGVLQAGFDRMVAGLRERERIRETFGANVDREAAEHVLREETALEGEEVEVTLMVVDNRDFTGFAEAAPARDVVAAINRLFERAVPIFPAHKGHVDKSVGDGLLAVFGAPRRCDDHADQAVAAALAIARAGAGPRSARRRRPAARGAVRRAPSPGRAGSGACGPRARRRARGRPRPCLRSAQAARMRSRWRSAHARA